MFTQVLVALVLSLALPSGSVAQQNPNQPAAPAKELTRSQFVELQAKAEAGDAKAQLELGKAYANGDGVSQDDAVATKWIRMAAEGGNADAQYALGTMYRNGDCVAQDKAEALKWYRKAARQNHADAMYSLGTAYYNGDGVDIDDAAAYAWFTLAKQAGSEGAVEALKRADAELKPIVILRGWKEIAKIYEKGDVLQQDQAEAARWWWKAAEEGDDEAQAALAIRSIAGLGVPLDLYQAEYWCNEVRKQHSENRACDCMNALGQAYEFGLGAKKDQVKARLWYQQAAARGNVAAMKALARMYAAGEGGAVDRFAAFLLYLRLAQKKDADAPHSLVILRKAMNEKEWKDVARELKAMNIDSQKLDASLQRAGNQ